MMQVQAAQPSKRFLRRSTSIDKMRKAFADDGVFHSPFVFSYNGRRSCDSFSAG